MRNIANLSTAERIEQLLLENTFNHVRKTITFTGASGLGLVDVVVPIFTITGRVLLEDICAYCTVNLAGATATISLGTAIDVDAFIAVTTATDVDADEWWTGAAPAAGSKSPVNVETGGLVISQGKKLLREDIIVNPLVETVTGGVLIVDAWHRPITDGSGLTGD